MSDEAKVRQGIAAAEAEGREIDDTTARIIAAWWYGPDAPKLTAFVGSGAIAEDTWGDVADEYKSASEFDRKALDFLGTYFIHHGQRGRQENWHNRTSY